MAAFKWLSTPGFLGTLTQEQYLSIPLAVSTSTATFSVISGSLPAGLVLGPTSTSTTSTTVVINGGPFSVSATTHSKFVIRAKNSQGIADATFTLDVSGGTPPTWVTPTGFIPVGANGEFYTVNKQPVNFQFTAEANVENTNTNLTFYIADGDGNLPNGLSLSLDGKLSGYINQDLTTVNPEFTEVGYDAESYDNYPYDFIALIDGNYVKPDFITQLYQFYVTASDGFTTNRQLFEILLLDHNSLKVDTTWFGADSSYFANVGPDFAPTWLSPVNLGFVRSGEYQVIELSEYDPFPEVGPISFSWNYQVNPQIASFSNTTLDPYHEVLENNYAGTDTIQIINSSGIPQVGQYFCLADNNPGADTQVYQISIVTNTGVDSYTLGIRYGAKKQINPDTQEVYVIYTGTTLLQDIQPDTPLFIGSLNTHPPGLTLNPNTGALYGNIPPISIYNQTYQFTVRTTKYDVATTDTVYSNRVFTLTLLSDIQSTILWDTPKLVGGATTGHQSELSLKAHHVGDDLGIKYNLISGDLPKGLTLNIDGTISGTIPYGSVTTIDENTFKLDGGKTTIDQQYYFVAEASDNYNLTAITGTFYIQILDNSVTPFTNMYVQPFMSRDKRKSYRDFITNETLFNKADLYRPYDPAFGIQYQIQLLIEIGIQELALADYVISLQQYFYNKKFYFGDVKSIPATDIEGNTIYELVYLDIVDLSESTYGANAKTVGIKVNGKNAIIYPNNVTNWRSALESTPIRGKSVQVDETLRPRFMNSIQADTGAPLGFIKAVPICYALPGKGAQIVEDIQLTGFDFKLLDFEVDRIIVEQTQDQSTAKYLKFPRTSIVVPTPTVSNDIAGEDGYVWVFNDGNILTTE